LIAALVEPKTRLTTKKNHEKKHKKNILAKILFYAIIVLFFQLKDSFNQQSTKAELGSWVGW
jgi:hypothetical protein